MPLPDVGMIAIHLNGQLDGRRVTEVSEDGEWIKIHLIISDSDWLPAINYRFVADPRGGYRRGYEEGHAVGYERGRTEGWDSGYETGREEGWDDALESEED